MSNSNNKIYVKKLAHADPNETERIEEAKIRPKSSSNDEALHYILQGVFFDLAERLPTETELKILYEHRDAISEFIDSSRKVANKMGNPKPVSVVYEISKDPMLGGLGKLQNALGEVAKLIFSVIPLSEGQYLWGLHSRSIAGIYVEKLDPFLPKDQEVDPCLQALVAMTLQHERVHWLKSTDHFKQDVPFASAIGWVIYHEVLSHEESDKNPFNCNFNYDVGQSWMNCFEYWRGKGI